MTGREALVELVVNKKRVRHRGWAPSNYLAVTVDANGDHQFVDHNGVICSVFSYGWKSNDWELYQDPYTLADLFRVLGPGKHAKSNSLPGVKIMLSEGRTLISSDGTDLVLNEALVNAKYWVYPAGVEIVASRQEMLK